jgi:hypothetical protein
MRGRGFHLHRRLFLRNRTQFGIYRPYDKKKFLNGLFFLRLRMSPHAGTIKGGRRLAPCFFLLSHSPFVKRPPFSSSIFRSSTGSPIGILFPFSPHRSALFSPVSRFSDSDASCESSWHRLCFIYKWRFDMDRQKIRFLISTLIDSSLYLTMPLKDRMSLLSQLTRSYPALFISEGFDESTDGDSGTMLA